MTTNTAFTTQTVLCEALYCLALLYYIHVQHERSLPFTYNPASVVKKKLVEVFRVSHVHTTSTPQFRLCHLHINPRNTYACDSTDI